MKMWDSLSGFYFSNLYTLNTVAEDTGERGHIMEFLQFLTMLAVFLLLAFSIYYLIHIGNNFLYRDKRIIIGKTQIFYFVMFFFIVLIMIGFYQIRNFLLHLAAPFLAAFAIAYILNPLASVMDRKGIKRHWGVLLIYLGIIAVVVILSISFFPRIGTEAGNLMEVLPGHIETAYGWLQSFYESNFHRIPFLPENLEGLGDMIDLDGERIGEFFMGAFSTLTTSFRGFFTRIINIILTPIITFYFLKDRERFKQWTIQIIPERIRGEMMMVGQELNTVLGGFVRGQLLVAIFVGTLTTISLLILRVDFAVLVGVIAGVANIIPYLGPIIGIIPATFFALLDSPVKALWVILIFTAIQQIESGILVPRVMGRRVGIHPVFVMLAMMIGSRVFGVLGLLIAVPTAATVKVLGKHFIALIKRI